MRTPFRAFLTLIAFSLALVLFPRAASAQIPQPSDTTSVPIPEMRESFHEWNPTDEDPMVVRMELMRKARLAR